MKPKKELLCDSAAAASPWFRVGELGAEADEKRLKLCERVNVGLLLLWGCVLRLLLLLLRWWEEKSPAGSSS